MSDSPEEVQRRIAELKEAMEAPFTNGASTTWKNLPLS